MKEKDKWFDLPEGLELVYSPGVSVSKRSDGVLNFKNKKPEPSKDSLSPRQKAAWLRSQDPRNVEQHWSEGRRGSTDREEDAEGLNKLMEDIVDRMPFMARDWRATTPKRLDELEEAVSDQRVFLNDHMDMFGTGPNGLIDLEMLTEWERKIKLERRIREIEKEEENFENFTDLESESVWDNEDD